MSGATECYIVSNCKVIYIKLRKDGRLEEEEASSTAE